MAEGGRQESKMRRRSYSDIKIAFSIVAWLIASAPLEARAFNDDGLKSGMDINVALDAFRAAFGQANEVPPGSKGGAYMNFEGPLRAIQFCHDKLTSYEKELPGSDEQAFAKAVAAESNAHGKPKHTVKQASNPTATYEIYSWDAPSNETQQLVLTTIGNGMPYIRLLRFVENDCGITGY
jgi:hypothetical protein